MISREREREGRERERGREKETERHLHIHISTYGVGPVECPPNGMSPNFIAKMAQRCCTQKRSTTAFSPNRLECKSTLQLLKFFQHKTRETFRT